MTAHLVLARPGAPVPDEASVIIADRFSVLGFVFPVFWLLFNRLWLESLVAALVMAVSAMLASTGDFAALGLALGFAVQLLTGLEGRNWRVSALERRGWRLVDVVETYDADAAFEIHAARAAGKLVTRSGPVEAVQRRPMALGKPRAADAIGLVPMERK